MINTSCASHPYLCDILDQPAALRDTLAGLDLSGLRRLAERLTSGEFRQVALTGMGSSYHALHPLRLTLIARGCVAHMIETSELIHHAPALLEPRTLVVAVSQSGQSAEIVRLLEQARGRTPLIGVTNSADSPLAAQSDAVLLTHAGPESTVTCKTYLATLATLSVLGEALTGNDPRPVLSELGSAPEAVAGYLAQWRAHVETGQRRMEDVSYLIVVGRGPSLAAVGTAGLIIKEAARFPAEGMSCAAFRHGPLEMISPHVFVLVYRSLGSTAEFDARLVADICAAGGQAALVVEAREQGVFNLPPVPDAVRPLVEILPAQMLSLALANLRGHQAGRFERASKVTTTE